MNTVRIHIIHALALFLCKHNFYLLNNVFLQLFLNWEREEQYKVTPWAVNEWNCDWKVNINKYNMYPDFHIIYSFHEVKIYSKWSNPI